LRVESGHVSSLVVRGSPLAVIIVLELSQ
jgi:hypothetical protein